MNTRTKPGAYARPTKRDVRRAMEDMHRLYGRKREPKPTPERKREERR